MIYVPDRLDSILLDSVTDCATDEGLRILYKQFLIDQWLYQANIPEHIIGKRLGFQGGSPHLILPAWWNAAN